MEIIGFIFSKPMNFDSVNNGITITPSISGYIKQMDSEAKRFAFIPTEMYKIKQKYMIEIENSIEDKNGLNLFEDKKVFFTPSGNYLEIQKIVVNGQCLDFSSENEFYFTAQQNLTGKYEAEIEIDFSSQIEKESRQEALENINFSLIFPLSSESPVLTQIRWNHTPS